MKAMGNPSADVRTSNGLLHVQKGRCYMKPPLGDYHSNSSYSAPSYSRIEGWNRMCNQQLSTGDLTWMKREGFAVPDLKEVVFSDKLVLEPWATPVGYHPQMQKKSPKQKPTKRPPTKFAVNMPACADNFRIRLSPEVEWERKVKFLLSCSLGRMQCPTLLSEYMNLDRKSRLTSSLRSSLPSNRFESDDDEEMLIERLRCMRSMAQSQARATLHSTQVQRRATLNRLGIIRSEIIKQTPNQSDMVLAVDSENEVNKSLSAINSAASSSTSLNSMFKLN